MLGLFLLGTLFLVIRSIMYGIVLPYLWNSFVEPYFGGPVMTFWLAIGLGIVISFLVKEDKTQDIEKEFEDLLAISIFNSLLLPLAFLFFGWVVNQFI